jgi:hypothetical protein
MTLAWAIIPWTAAVSAAAAAAAASSTPWTPHFNIHGSYEGPICESTPFWWPKDHKMYLMESLCRGPKYSMDSEQNPYGGTWSHAEMWNGSYYGHSYIRIRELATGNIVSNISHSIGFGFGAAFVDYDHETLWISATPNDRANHTSERPYGPPHDFSCGHFECGVWVFNTTDLKTWTRTQTDISTKITYIPNTDIARVYSSKAHPTPSNLPPHRYIMATELGSTWIVNNRADGDLTQGWEVLNTSQAKGGALACPSVRYLPSDGYYYTISGGNIIKLQRSRDLLLWEYASLYFLQPSEADVLTASSVVASAADNLQKSNASLSFPHHTVWDLNSNDGDFCCESWGGAAPEKGGPESAYIVWGADGQGSSGWTSGPEGFAAIATANITLEKLLQSYFPS